LWTRGAGCCASLACGGERREEVWVDENGRVGRYSLAFILPTATVDNGRVLGYDNAHGTPERHLMGTVERAPVEDYEVTYERFQRELDHIRRTR
jgi:hypothetical protein